MRTFLAFDLAESNHEAAWRLQEALRQRGVHAKWSRPENLHLTVLFLGEQDEESLSRYSESLRNIAAATPAFTLSGPVLTTFGHPPRVLCLAWRGAGSEQYMQIAQASLQAADECGLHLPENVRNRQPLAHLTLARFRGSRDAASLREIGHCGRGEWQWHNLEPLLTEALGTVACTRLLLFKSSIGPDAPVYTVLREFELS